MKRNLSAKKLLFSLCLLLTFSSFAKNKIELVIKLNGQDYYSINKDKLNGVESRIKGEFIIRGMADGQSINLRQGIPTTQAPNTTNMEILGKKRVRIMESTHGVDAQVRAKVKKRFGKLRGLEIISEEYLLAMKPVLEQSGLDLLRNLQIQADDARVETNIDISDIDCAVDADELVCDSDVEVYMLVEEI